MPRFLFVPPGWEVVQLVGLQTLNLFKSPGFLIFFNELGCAPPLARIGHLAFRGQFRRLDGVWCLEITPTYRFTSDGFTLDRFHEENLKGIKRLEGNRAVLSSVLFWANYLQPRTGLFDRDPVPLQFGKLLTFRCDVAILDGDWLTADPGRSQESETLPDEFFLLDLDEATEL